jgi:hypothetical protein
LSERNFSRVLRDAHDADVIDLRRRGDDYDVALAVSAPPVAEQFNVAAGARTGANGPAPAATPAAPRGLGPRGSRRGAFGGRGTTLSPELLAVGVVDAPAGRSPPPVAVMEVAEEVPVAKTRSPAAKRPRARTKRGAADKAGSVAAAAPTKAKRARTRSPAKSTDG